jgi:hypothetical protein
MKTDFSEFPGDVIVRFNHKCLSCVKGGRCLLRFKMNRAMMTETPAEFQSLSFSNTKDMDILCDGFKESRRKGNAYYKRKRFLQGQAAKENNGQLRLF